MVVRIDLLRKCKTDKERILLAILTSLVGKERYYQEPSPTFLRLPHIAEYRKLAVGDLVIGSSGEIGYLVEIEELEDGNIYLVHPVGENIVVSWGNEDFSSIVGINKDYLLEGDQWLFYCYCLDNICRPLDTFFTVFFEGENCSIRLRCKYDCSKYKDYVIVDWSSFLKGNERNLGLELALQDS